MLNNTVHLFFLSLALMLFTAVPQIDCRIVTIDRMDNIRKEVNEDTVVLFDIDDTLIASPTFFGSGAFWEYFKQTLHTSGIEKLESAEFFAPIIEEIVKQYPMIAAEESTVTMIKEFQHSGIPVLGLTARQRAPFFAPDFDVVTREQLNKVEIHLEAHSLMKHQIDLSQIDEPEWAYGIIFSESQLKGPVLVEFLKKLGWKPSKVVFVDDRLDQIESVDNSLQLEGIPCVCFHYTYSDKQKLDFDPTIANLQMEAFLRDRMILGDLQAKKIKDDRPNMDSNFFLNQLFEEMKSSR